MEILWLAMLKRLAVTTESLRDSARVLQRLAWPPPGRRKNDRIGPATVLIRRAGRPPTQAQADRGSAMRP